MRVLRVHFRPQLNNRWMLILGMYRCYKRVLLKMTEIRDIGSRILSAELTPVGTEPFARS